ncbi:MAG: hypothetical protein WCE62_06375 [Polyangiales bacterium]
MSRSLKVTTLVSIAMVALLFAAIERGRTVRASEVLHRLPNTARAILRIDLGALDHTGAAKALFDAFIAEEQLSEIEAICGLDPLTSLREVTVWVRGPEVQPFQSIGLMLRGGPATSTTLAECHRRLVERRGGSIVRIDGPDGPVLASLDRRSAIAQLDERTIVTGSVDTVVEAMAVQRGTVPALVEGGVIAALWPKVSVGTCVSAAVDPPTHWKSALERIAERGTGASALQGVLSLALSIEAGSAETVHVYIDTAGAELAMQDAALIEQWRALPPEWAAPRWAEVLRSARVDVRHHAIVVTLDVSSLSRAR